MRGKEGLECYVRSIKISWSHIGIRIDRKHASSDDCSAVSYSTVKQLSELQTLTGRAHIETLADAARETLRDTV